MLGTGEWTIHVTRRGGGTVYHELIFDSISGSRPLDNTGQCRIRVPVSQKTIDMLNDIKTWRDEVTIYRNNEVAFIGPIIQKGGTRSSGANLQCQDLFHWTEKRFIDTDMTLTADVAENFSVIFDAAISPENSMGLEIDWHEAGQREVMHIIGKEFPRAADLLRGLARTALDFVTIGRTVYVGGEEVYTGSDSPFLDPIVLVDGGVMDDPDITEDGSELATDVAVFGEAVFVGSGERIFGRARRHVKDYGLIQASYAEPAIKNTEAAAANALSRMGQMYPLPLRGKVTLSPSADPEFKELLPGRRADCRLEDSVLIPLVETMRMAQMNFDVSPDEEKISLDLIPLGEREESFSAQ